MIRKVILLVLALALVGGASAAAAKPDIAATAKSKECVRYWTTATDTADFPCRLKGSYLATYTYGAGRSGNLTKVMIICGPERKTQHEDHMSGTIACTVHVAKGLKIARVYIEHRYAMKNKSVFVPKKHGSHGFSITLKNANYQITSNYPTLWVEAVPTG